MKATLAILVACSTPRPSPRAIEDEPAPRQDFDSFNKDLEAAYADRRRDRLPALRARAEQLSGQPATIGIAGDHVATLPSGLRVVTGRAGATLLDASNAPVGWFAIAEATGPCPPCGPNDKTIVTVPLDKLMLLLPQRHAYGAIVVDVDAKRTVASFHANLSSIAIAPTQIAIVELRHDADACRGALAIVTSGIRRHPPFAAPKDFCQGQTVAVWQDGKIIVSSEWSEERLIVDPATGGATPATQPHDEVLNQHHSSPLCGPDRARVKATGCTVDDRWVFPADACAGAKPRVDEPCE